MPPHIQRIIELTGPALLLPWPHGSKGSRKNSGWTKWPLTLMDDPVHQDRVAKAGNLGVALGDVSGGLVTIDLDSDEHVGEFLDANPALCETLRTKANRGCNFWLRIEGEYPRTHKIKKGGNEIGEFRANGAQTIIWGTHPDGMPYTFEVEKRPLLLSFNSIAFPEKRPESLAVIPSTETHRRLRHIDEETKKTCVGRVCIDNTNNNAIVGIPNEILAFKNIIASICPKDFGQTNSSLFMLARFHKDLENWLARPTTPEEKDRLFNLWCETSRPFWRNARDEYFAEFVRQCGNAKVGLHQAPLQMAYIHSGQRPLPQVVGFSDERMRRLAGMCESFHILLGGHPFFFPTRDTAELLGAHWTTVANWLRVLESFMHIALAPGEVRKRGGHRSPHYIYIKALKS